MMLDGPDPPWSSWTPQSSLHPESVHIWRVSLDWHDAYESLCQMVPPSERPPGQVHNPAASRRHLLARAATREILSRYLDCRPVHVQLARQEHGKPFVAHPGCQLQFNRSHTTAIALVAVTQGRAIGVDVEALREVADLDGIVDRYFASSEKRAILALTGEARAAAFFRCWTRKEAMLKAMGAGLSFPLDHFAVHVDAIKRVSQLLELEGSTEAASQWTLHDVDVGQGHAAALAWSGPPVPVQQFQWTQSLL